MRFRLRLPLQEIVFDTDDVVIGRDPDCALSFDDDLLSRRHAAIRGTVQGFELHDLGSRNGTWLNARRITAPEPLRDGDRIRIGVREIVFVGAVNASEPPTSKRARITARIERCAHCDEPNAADASVCAHCGHARDGR